MKPYIYIGIDGGAETGVAVWNKKEQRIEGLRTLDFWETYELILRIIEEYGEESIKVFIEDPSLNKPVFPDKLEDKEVKKQLRIAQNIGMNKRDAQIWISFCEKMFISHQTVRPKTEKWDQRYFEKITKLNMKVSEHARDACKLVYGFML